MKSARPVVCPAAVLLSVVVLTASATAAPAPKDSTPASRLWQIFKSSREHDLSRPMPTDRIGMYVRASKLIESATPSVDPAEDASPPQDAKGWAGRYSLARKEAWLKQNAAGFALFDKALHAPLLPKHVEQYGLILNMSRGAVLRQLARELIADVHAREMRGDWSGAAQRRLDILQVGNDDGAEGMLTDSLVGIAIQSIGINEASASVGRLTSPQAHAVIKRLDGLLQQRLRLSSALIGEKKYGHKQWNEVLAQPNWRDPKRFDDLSLTQRAELKTIKPAALMKAYDSEMDRQIKVARMPYSKMRQQSGPASTSLVAALAHDWPASAGFVFARTDVANLTWLTAIALQAYKLERGAYPQTLRGLVPGFLPRVPIDPFSGIAPLRYRRTKNTYILWSIGPDGIDDGGKPVVDAASKRSRRVSPAAPPSLPSIFSESKGDYVSGKNR